MSFSDATVRTPQSIEEFRRLGHVFLAGSRFSAGTEVYIVASLAGTRPVQAIIPRQPTSASYALVDEALRTEKPRGFSDAEAAEDKRVVYRVTVPAISRLNMFEDDDHGGTDVHAMMRLCNSDEPPPTATRADMASVEVRITWTGNRGVSVYEMGDNGDAIFLTRGAIEMFAFPAYASAYGDDYVQLLKAKLVAGGASTAS